MAIDFMITDSQQIEDTILTELAEHVGEILYPGDERKIFGDSLAMVCMVVYNYINSQMQQRFLENSRGEVTDEFARDANVQRIAPTPASDTIKFTLSAEQGRNVIIPQGTRVTPDGLVFFATEDVGIIPAGDTSVNVVAVCTEPGEDYNGIEAGTITTLVDPINYVSEVTNLYGTDGGDDGETYTEEGDERLKERIRLANLLATDITEDAYIYHTMTADASIVDVYIDSPNPFYIVIYPLLEGGKLPDSDLITKITKVFNNDLKKDRHLADYVTVQSPTQVEYDIKFKYYVTVENEKAAINLVEREGGMIDSYIKWQCEKLGRSINPDALRRELMDNTDELGVLVERVTITSPTFQELTAKQVAKFSGTLQVSHEVVSER